MTGDQQFNLLILMAGGLISLATALTLKVVEYFGKRRMRKWELAEKEYNEAREAAMKIFKLTTYGRKRDLSNPDKWLAFKEELYEVFSVVVYSMPIHISTSYGDHMSTIIDKHLAKDEKERKAAEERLHEMLNDLLVDVEVYLNELRRRMGGERTPRILDGTKLRSSITASKKSQPMNDE